MKKNKDEVVFKIKDNNSVYFKDNHFWVKKCALEMNKSKIFFDAVADRKKNFEVNVFSDKIEISDILTIFKSQIIENNLEETLSYFNDLDGDFKFNVIIKNNDINGNFDINKVSCKVVPVKNIPVTLKKRKHFTD